MSKDKLPEYPRVFTNEEHVVIEYEDGSSEIWSVEDTIESAREVALGLNLQLKAIRYVTERVDTHTDVLVERLRSLGLDGREVCVALYEGLVNNLPVKKESSGWEAREESGEYASRLKLLEESFRIRRQGVEGVLRDRFMEEFLRKKCKDKQK